MNWLLAHMALFSVFASRLAAATAIPNPGASWDWQLSAPLDLSVKADILDIDPDSAPLSRIARLKRRGVYLVCYVSIGTWENWRKDKNAFPSVVLGKAYGEWPDERFLDIRRLDILLPVMRARFARCKNLGFAAVEADNMDAYDNDSGFPLTARDTLRYVRALARMAHEMGLAMAQKNVPDLSGQLVHVLDFAITESCIQDGWCAKMAPWRKAGRPILDAEYVERPLNLKRACRDAARFGLSLIVKTRDLTRWRKTCPR